MRMTGVPKRVSRSGRQTFFGRFRSGRNKRKTGRLPASTRLPLVEQLESRCVLSGQPPVAVDDYYEVSADSVLAVYDTSVALGTPNQVRWETSVGGNGHVYERIPGNFTWAGARDAASARTLSGSRGHLLTITSSSEQNFLRSTFPDSRSWIGAYQDVTSPDYSEPNGGWRWVTGEEWSFTNWATLEPNDQGAENFVELGAGFQWNDLSLEQSIGGYWVEYPLESTLVSQRLISAGSNWKYWDTGSAPATDWMNIGYSDTAWSSGLAELGYGEADETTTVGFGPDSSSKYVTTYFRQEFVVNNPNVVNELILYLKRDDGAIVYLNGREVVRDGIPAGSNELTLGVEANDDGQSFQSFRIEPRFLNVGTNVVAVEVHQASQLSDDLSFDGMLIARSQGVVGVTSNDVDRENDALLASLVSSPTHGTISFPTNGKFVYTPDPAFRGLDQFSYRIDDGTSFSSPAIVRIRVVDPNMVPNGVPDVFQILKDTQLSVTTATGILANDSDPDGDALHAVLVTATKRGSLTLAGDGGFHYVPQEGFIGTDWFDYRVIDGKSESGVVRVSIGVGVAGSVPLTRSDRYMAYTGQKLVVNGPTSQSPALGLNQFVWGQNDGGNGHAYELVSFEGDWQTARTLASQRLFGESNGYLATVTSHAESQFLAGHLGISESEAFLGGYKIVTESGAGGRSKGWRWITGEPWSYTNWGGGAFGADAEKYLEIFGPWGYAWNDVPRLMIRNWYLVEYPWDEPIRRSEVIPRGAAWKYNDDGANLGTAWRYRGYQVAAWKTGNAEFGYGDGDEQTVVDFGNDPFSKYITTYFRREFDLTNVGNVENLELLLETDDAIVVYLNGKEVLRHGVSENPQYRSASTFTTFDKQDLYQFSIDPATLVEGTNLLAVEVHQAPNSGDLSFDMKLEAIHRAQHGLLANDFDPEGDALEVVLESEPSHGTLVLSPNGLFTYAPDPGYVGQDQFSYRARDQYGSSEVTVASIDVHPYNVPPVAMDDNYEISDGNALEVGPSIGVLANDVDTNGDAITAEMVVAPQHGTVAVGSDGSIRYVPADQFSGLDHFVYRAIDGTHSSSIATVTITVRRTPQIPVVRDDKFVGVEDQWLVIDNSLRQTIATATISSGNPRWLAYDAVGGMIYATVPINNVVVPINPFNGEMETPISVPGRPEEIAVTDDGQFLYVGTDGIGSVTRIRIATRTIDRTIFIGQGSISDLDTIAGRPESVVVARSSNERTVIYDNGVARPRGHGSTTQVEVSDDGFTLFTFNSASSALELTEYNIVPDGFNYVVQRPNLVGNGHFVYSDGLLLFDSGQILDAAGFRPKGIISRTGVGQVVALPHTNRVAYITDATDTIQISDLGTQQRVANIQVPGRPTARQGVAFGTDGIAFVAEGTSTVYLVRSDVVRGATRYDVIANDFDPENEPLSAFLVEGTQHGTLTLNVDGTFRYQPELNFHGNDSFRYRVSDGRHFSNVATVTLQLGPTNDAPRAADDTYTLSRRDGQLVTTDTNGLLRNDADVDGDQLTALLVTQPTHGTVLLHPDGTFAYLAGANFALTDSFTYRASDGRADSAIATVIIELDVPRVVLGDIQLRANTPNQQIPIYVHSNIRVSGANLYVQVGDGGPELTDYGIPAGIDGPSIRSIDLKTGTIFASVSDPQVDQAGIPQVATATIAISSDADSVIADGLLAIVTVDTTGFFTGTWDLRLTDVLPYPELAGPFSTDFAGTPAIIHSGRVIIQEAQVVARQIFYANSQLGPLPIAEDKVALMPGQTASFVNYSSYSRGINGMVIDVTRFLRRPIVSDFQFRMGRSSNIGGWGSAPPPIRFDVVDPGVEDLQRIIIQWNDGAILNQWLEVRLLVSAETGVVTPDLFYFGNAPGDTGDSATNALVNATDIVATRDNKRGPFNPAAISNRYDFNRDGLVNATDVIFARDHVTSPFNALPLISPNTAQSSAVARVPRAPLPARLIFERPSWDLNRRGFRQHEHPQAYTVGFIYKTVRKP